MERTDTTSTHAEPIASAADETKLPLVDEQNATGDLAAAYLYCRQRTGRESVPAIVRCFGVDPELLMRMIDFAQPLLFEEGLLGRRMKETIATWISGLNRCPYCADSHGYYLQQEGASRGTVDALIAEQAGLADLTAKERSLLDYLALVNSASYRTTREQVTALTASGWSEAQIVEAVHVAAFMGLCNRVANAFGLPSQNRLIR